LSFEIVLAFRDADSRYLKGCPARPVIRLVSGEPAQARGSIAARIPSISRSPVSVLSSLLALLRSMFPALPALRTEVQNRVHAMRKFLPFLLLVVLMIGPSFGAGRPKSAGTAPRATRAAAPRSSTRRAATKSGTSARTRQTVKGYTRKNGTRVAPYHRRTAKKS